MVPTQLDAIVIIMQNVALENVQAMHANMYSLGGLIWQLD